MQKQMAETAKTALEYWDEAVEIYRRRQRMDEAEYPTGILPLDNKIDGLHKGHLCIIAGKAGSGKTSLALQIARGLADKPTNHILFLTLEMKGSELMARVFCNMGEIDNDQWRNGTINEQEFLAKAKMLENAFAKIDFEIIENGYNFEEVKNIIKGIYHKTKPDIIFIDFVQLIEVRRGEDERLALTSYVRKLKELAKTEDIAIVLLSQIRRLPSGADYNRPPSLIDLKGSGSLENLADEVILIYHTAEEVKIAGTDKTEKIRKTFLKIAKNRHGAIGEFEIDFRGKYFKFQGGNDGLEKNN